LKFKYIFQKLNNPLSIEQMAQVNPYIINNIINNYNELFNSNYENDNINSPVHIYVKFAYQTTSATYIMSRNLSLAQMVHQLRQNILRDFGTEYTQYELVEAGQTMPLGIPAEEAPAFVIESSSIRQRFHDQNSVAFYIRLFPPTASSSWNTTTTSELSSEEDETPCCMVCQESDISLTTYFGCSHHICDGCCGGCIQAGITRCAICRHQG